MFGNPTYDAAQESAVGVAQDGMVKALLAAGKSVVIDNTHLHPLAIKHWRGLADFVGVKFEVKTFAISVEKAKANVAKRAAAGGLFVPDDVIDAQHGTLNKFAASFK
jgi:predicted kinase